MEDRLPTGEDEADRLRKAARSAWGDWLNEYSWHHFLTLTFVHPSSLQAVDREFRTWLRRVEQRAGRAVAWFWAREIGAAGSSHLHVQVIGTSHLTCDNLRAAWRNGNSHAVVYNPRKNPRKQASYYVAKELAADATDFDLDLRRAR